MTTEGQPIDRAHCHGCACDLFARDVVLVPVSGELLAQLQRDGWSAPVAIRLDPTDQPGGWEMTCRSIAPGTLI